MNINIRELLEFHTRFDTGEGFLNVYADSVHEKYAHSGATREYSIVLTKTHKKLITQAQKQNILHRDIGYIRALQLTETVHYYDVELKSIDGSMVCRGTSLSLDEAVARAFGELYERVSLRFVPQNQPIIYKSYKQLRKATSRLLNIHDVAKATDQQKALFPDMVWNDDSVFGWVEMENIYTGEQTFVPAQLAYWGYKRNADEPFIGEPNTSGLGAGYTQEEAFMSGAYELLQRHSFFTYWYGKETPPKINSSSVLESSCISNDTKTLIKSVREYGFTIHLADCTLEKSVPSITAILTKPGLGWFLGMTTSPDLGKAIERALCEALSVYTWTMSEVSDLQADAFIFDVKKIQPGFCNENFNGRLRVYAWSRKEMAEHGTFFLQGHEKNFDDVRTRYSGSVRDVLGSITGNQVFIKRADQAYLEEVKFHSARLVAPHLYKLSLHERLSTPILNEVLPKNLYPHPFP